MTITVTNLAKQINKFLDYDWDYIMAVSGLAGVGKSSFIVQLARAVDPHFTHARNNFYSRKAFKKAIWDYTAKSFLNADEAINMLYRRDFYEQKQKNLLKDLDVIRDRNMAAALLIPNFWDFDSKILNSKRLKIWIYIDKRGIGYIFRPDNNPFNPDPWNRMANLKLLKNWMRGMHPRISPNYMDTVKFDPLGPEDYAEYKKVKDEKKRAASDELEDELEDRERVWHNQRDNLVKALYDSGTMNQGEIAAKIGTTKSTVSDIIQKLKHNSKEE
jgi:hypothetical protein